MLAGYSGLGGDVKTYNFGINGSYYWNLRGDTIFSINAGAATVDSYGDHDVPILNASTSAARTTCAASASGTWLRTIRL